MKHWGIVVCYTLLTYLSLPFARTWQRFFRERLGSDFSLSINLFILAAGLLTVLWVFRKAAKAAFWLAVALLILLLALAAQMNIPEERIHLLQYGILGYFIARAIRPNLSLMVHLGVATLIGTLIGLGDEMIQWVLPNRFFDWRDVGTNLTGVAFGAAIFHILK
ncbi:MAG: VanZ family protein [Nitrospiria bacterium]